MYRSLLQAIALAATCATGLSASCNAQMVSQVQELSNKLSDGTQVFQPGSQQFNDATLRWSALDEPNPNVVIVPATEQDVAQIVRPMDDLYRCWTTPLMV